MKDKVIELQQQLIEALRDNKRLEEKIVQLNKQAEDLQHWTNIFKYRAKEYEHQLNQHGIKFKWNKDYSELKLTMPASQTILVGEKSLLQDVLELRQEQAQPKPSLLEIMSKKK